MRILNLNNILYTSINEFKKYLENITIPKLRLPQKPINTNYKDIDWQEIEIIDNGNTGNIIHLNIVINNIIEPGIVLDIQLINNLFYQPHISVHKSIQRQNIAYKVYKKFLYEFGHLYSSKGRRMNHIINKLYDKLKNDNNFSIYKNNNNDILIILNTNPDKNILLNTFNKINENNTNNIFSSNDIIQHIIYNTEDEDEDDIPEYFLKKIKKDNLKYELKKLYVEDILNMDLDVKEYVLNSNSRYEDKFDDEYERPIVIHKNEVFDGYSRLQYHYNNGIDKIQAYVSF